MALHHRLVQLICLSPREWYDLLRAVIELAIANRRLAKAAPTQQMLKPYLTSSEPADDPKLLNRVARAIPRAAVVVPWRADCLRQALAAASWLSRFDIETEIRIGVRKDADGELRSHAWLCHQGDVLIGGAIEDFSELPLQPSSDT